MLTRSIESTYKRFVYFVTQNRKKLLNKLMPLAVVEFGAEQELKKLA
jgi:hypothetical protein